MEAGKSIVSERWAEVMDQASFDVWDQGEEPGEMVQPGTWRGRRIEVVYRLPEDFEDRMTEAQMRGEGDAYLDTLVTAIRYLERWACGTTSCAGQGTTSRNGRPWRRTSRWSRAAGYSTPSPWRTGSYATPDWP